VSENGLRLFVVKIAPHVVARVEILRDRSVERIRKGRINVKHTSFAPNSGQDDRLHRRIDAPVGLKQLFSD
jgi:hypothetical protein